MPSESNLESKCNKKLKEVYKNCIIVKNIQYIGFPDRTVYTDKGCFLIEYKKEKGVLSKAQAKMIFNLKVLGFKVYIIRSLEDLVNIFRDF